MTFLDVSENEDIMTNYFPFMLKLNIYDYIINPYYRNIELNDICYKNWEVKMMSYKPYELFVYDDLLKLDEGRIIPHIGYYACMVSNIENVNKVTIVDSDREAISLFKKYIFP